MPVGSFKNRLYRLALPLYGMKTKGIEAVSPSMDTHHLHQLADIFHRHHVIGGCLQLIKEGKLGPLITYGYARMPVTVVKPDTVFRAASITKMITAVGAMTLCEKGLLDLDAPLDRYLPYPVRNPHFPNTPILVRHLFHHTSSIWDGPGYDKALHSSIPLKSLLDDTMNYLPVSPGETFRYSNLAAGIIGSLIEIASCQSLETYMQESVFAPVQMNASYTLKKFLSMSEIACIYRVLTKLHSHRPQYDPVQKLETADAFIQPAPEYRYLPAAGNLLTDAASLGNLVCMLINKGENILSNASVQKMQTPAAEYGKQARGVRHCLGLVAIDDPALKTGRLYGHQGFAYGAAEGVFYQTSTGNGFVFLNSGASEARYGHLACVNRELILWALSKDGYQSE